MHNLDSFFILKTLLLSFAETYSEGSYGSGSYNESPATDAPTGTDLPAKSSSTTPVAAEQTTLPEDQPVTSTGEQPRTTTTQPSSDPSATDSQSEQAIAGTDPFWIIIASFVALSALTAIILLAVKKLRRQ